MEVATVLAIGSHLFATSSRALSGFWLSLPLPFPIIGAQHNKSSTDRKADCRKKNDCRTKEYHAFDAPSVGLASIALGAKTERFLYFHFQSPKVSANSL
jgi:hypothetical protein